jgi:hypothetical protein
MDSCIITGLPTNNYNKTDLGFEYKIKYKKREYRLKFPAEFELFDDYKKALKSLLFREEWPFDQEYAITRELIERMLRQRRYPNRMEFDRKVLAYLEWLYNNGGREHKLLQFNQSEYWQAHANDEEEFSRLFEDLEHKGFISPPKNNEFKLTKEGIKTAENLIASRPEKILEKYRDRKKPRIGIVHAYKDAFAAGKLSNYIIAKGFPTFSFNGLEEDGFLSNSSIHNMRHAIKGDDREASADYWIFVKSANSDHNNGFGSLLTIATETHKEWDATIYGNMISIAAIDDSSMYTWPCYSDYYKHFFDIRLESGKETLLEVIIEDWVKQLDTKLKTKEDFWNWLISFCKQINNYLILIRPWDMRALIDTEAQLKEFLVHLNEEKVITYRELPGCRKDNLEYEVKVLTEEDKKAIENGEKVTTYTDLSPLESIDRILVNFHKIAVKLRERREDRQTIVINDEYDAQDLLYSLLQLYFQDVRKEDYNISNVGSNSKPDFILKLENIGIEVKMTSEKLRDKKIGDQLLADIGRFKSHPNCKTLVLFIYDKGDFIRNKAGLKRDLEKQRTTEMDIKVYIVPI